MRPFDRAAACGSVKKKGNAFRYVFPTARSHAANGFFTLSRAAWGSSRRERILHTHHHLNRELEHLLLVRAVLCVERRDLTVTAQSRARVQGVRVCVREREGEERSKKMRRPQCAHARALHGSVSTHVSAVTRATFASSAAASGCTARSFASRAARYSSISRRASACALRRSVLRSARGRGWWAGGVGTW